MAGESRTVGFEWESKGNYQWSRNEEVIKKFECQINKGKQDLGRIEYAQESSKAICPERFVNFCKIMQENWTREWRVCKAWWNYLKINRRIWKDDVEFGKISRN